MIGFVICGIEHSGTTLVSDLFRQVPGVDAGLETGVLLSRSPREFPSQMPFAAWILDCWSITAEELAFCCQTESFAVFYDRLSAASRVLKPGTVTTFDKTPRYLSQLDDCLGRIDVPFVVTCKDPRSIVFSDFVRAKAADFDAWFESYAAAKLGYMRQVYAAWISEAASGPRVLRMPLETLCLQPERSCEAMFAHCGQEFSSEYLLLRNLRYSQTRSASISARMPFEYQDVLSAARCAAILRQFAEFDAWFYG